MLFWFDLLVITVRKIYSFMYELLLADFSLHIHVNKIMKVGHSQSWWPFTSACGVCQKHTAYFKK